MHDINMLFKCNLHIRHHLRLMKMIILKLFLICMFKDANFAEKFKNLVEKLNSLEFIEFVFSKSVTVCGIFK